MLYFQETEYADCFNFDDNRMKKDTGLEVKLNDSTTMKNFWVFRITEF